MWVIDRESWLLLEIAEIVVHRRILPISPGDQSGHEKGLKPGILMDGHGGPPYENARSIQLSAAIRWPMWLALHSNFDCHAVFSRLAVG